MNMTDEDFLRQLQQAFAEEAHEHVQTITDGLLAIEQKALTGPDDGRLEEIYRAAHSLKGAARAVDERRIELVAHAMESVFIAMRRKGLELGVKDYDQLQAALDVLGGVLAGDDPSAKAVQTAASSLESLAGDMADSVSDSMVAASVQQESAKSPKPESQKTPAVEEQQKHVELSDDSSPPSSPVDSPPEKSEPEAVNAGDQMPPQTKAGKGTETMRVAVAKLDSFLFSAEGMLSGKLALEQRIADSRGLHDLLERAKKLLGKLENSQAKSTSKEHLSEARTALDDLGLGLGNLSYALRADLRSVAAQVKDLMDGAMKVLMFPFANLAGAFPKMVRDLAREKGKGVDFQLAGGDVEVDKRILERIKDPLIHLLRNCIDHGIEAPDVREKLSKPRRGKIVLDVSESEGDKVRVTVADDGAGIDAEAVRKAAVEKLGMITGEAEALDGRELHSLIFSSGLSTSRMITDISGRGLGMAIVQEAVESLGGRIQMETSSGEGTRISLVLPLTLATFRGTLVRSAGRDFVLPTANVERVVRLLREDIRTAENREVVPLDGQPCSLAWLDAALGIVTGEEEKTQSGAVTALVLGTGDRRMALGVDQVIGEQDVLVKSLGKHLTGLKNIAGATVLGSGRVVPVLNTIDLMDSVVRGSHPARRTIVPDAEDAAKSVLVVEDSITSRTLIKNIIESAGYEVRTAVDGVDGLTALRSSSVDLAVLDIDMPRMNGFQLTEAIRQDEKLSELPIVLVTARSTREDRERGIELGANAYLIKSTFDQTNLLDVIRQLI